MGHQSTGIRLWLQALVQLVGPDGQQLVGLSTLVALGLRAMGLWRMLLPLCPAGGLSGTSVMVAIIAIGEAEA